MGYNVEKILMIAPEIMSVIQIFQHDFGVSYDKQTTKEHYQLSSTTAIRMFTKSFLIQQSIIKHCGGNLFSLKEMKLMNIASNMLIPDNAK